MSTSVGRRFLSLFAIFVAVVLLGGCDSDAAVVRLQNDTASDVELRLCAGSNCDKFSPPRYELAPDDSVEVNVSKTGAPNFYAVIDADGRKTGCLPIVVHNPPDTVLVRVSARVPCTDEVPEEWP